MFVKIYSTKNVVWENTWFSYKGRAKKNKCGQCNKMFTTCRNLDNPQKMHNERRAHECDKTVKRKGELRLHQKKYM